MQEISLASITSASAFNTVVISAVVSTLVVVASKYFELWKSAEIAHKFEQRKVIKTAIGSHLGRILVAAERLENRFTNLSGNHDKNWLSLKVKRSESGYYIKSTAVRFLVFFDAVLSAEESYICLDARFADNADLEFLSYISFFQFVMRDIETLFKNLPHDRSKQSDHFYADSLRGIRHRFKKEDVSSQDIDDLQLFFDDEKNDFLLQYFHALQPSEGRPRWDRTVVLHLTICAFLDAFGNTRHSLKSSDFQKIAQRVDNPKVLINYLDGLAKFDLVASQTSAKLIVVLEKAYLERTGGFF